LLKGDLGEGEGTWRERRGSRRRKMKGREGGRMGIFKKIIRI